MKKVACVVIFTHDALKKLSLKLHTPHPTHFLSRRGRGRGPVQGGKKIKSQPEKNENAETAIASHMQLASGQRSLATVRVLPLPQAQQPMVTRLFVFDVEMCLAFHCVSQPCLVA